MTNLVHGFVDGAYLRKVCERLGWPLADPRAVVECAVRSPVIKSWAEHGVSLTNVLGRVTYYDAWDAEPKDKDVLPLYWDAVELLNDTHLGFGKVEHGRKRKRKQKGVDTLIATDMLVGAFSGIFGVAVLVAGDADFVPVIDEVKRRGVMVALVGDAPSVAEDLMREVDRYITFAPHSPEGRSVNMIDMQFLTHKGERFWQENDRVSKRPHL